MTKRRRHGARGAEWQRHSHATGTAYSAPSPAHVQACVETRVAMGRQKRAKARGHIFAAQLCAMPRAAGLGSAQCCRTWQRSVLQGSEVLLTPYATLRSSAHCCAAVLLTLCCAAVLHAALQQKAIQCLMLRNTCYMIHAMCYMPHSLHRVLHATCYMIHAMCYMLQSLHSTAWRIAQRGVL